MFIVKIEMLKGFEWFDGKRLYSRSEAELFSKEFLMNYTGWENYNPNQPYLFKPYTFDIGEAGVNEIKVNEFKDHNLDDIPWELPRLNRIVLDGITLDFNGRAYICNGNGETLERISECSILRKNLLPSTGVE